MGLNQSDWVDPYNFGHKTDLAFLFSAEPERSRGTATEPFKVNLKVHFTRSSEIIDAQAWLKS